MKSVTKIIKDIINQELDLMKELVECTVIFSDLGEFSLSMSKNVNKGIYRAIIHNETIINTCEGFRKKYSGKIEICKTIGDEVMICVYGENNNKIGLKISQKIISEIRKLNDDFGDDLALSTKIGMASGKAYNIEIEGISNYTIDPFGKVVNTAARLVKLAKSWQILIPTKDLDVGDKTKIVREINLLLKGDTMPQSISILGEGKWIPPEVIPIKQSKQIEQILEHSRSEEFGTALSELKEYIKKFGDDYFSCMETSFLLRQTNLTEITKILDYIELAKMFNPKSSLPYISEAWIKYFNMHEKANKAINLLSKALAISQYNEDLYSEMKARIDLSIIYASLFLEQKSDPAYSEKVNHHLQRSKHIFQQTINPFWGSLLLLAESLNSAINGNLADANKYYTKAIKLAPRNKIIIFFGEKFPDILQHGDVYPYS